MESLNFWGVSRVGYKLEKKNQQISNAHEFTLTAQTNAALARTLRCHATLLDDILRNGQEFVLAARFQSDPIERGFGQYRQMSGGDS